MSALASLDRSRQHQAWADRRVLAALRAQPELPAALRLFAHLLAAEQVWLLRLRGENAGGTPIWPDHGSLEQCAAQLERNVQDYAAYFGTLPEAGLDEVAHYQNSQGTAFSTSVADILTQVFTHGAYHRGQIALLLREAGLEPVNTDFITFARAGA